MSISSKEAVQKLLYEYGSALRGDWSYFDGRTARADLDIISEVLDEESITNEELMQIRADLDLCPEGRGHWTKFCDDDC